MGIDGSLKAITLLRPKWSSPCTNTPDAIAQDVTLWARRVQNETDARPVVLDPRQLHAMTGQLLTPCGPFHVVGEGEGLSEGRARVRSRPHSQRRAARVPARHAGRHGGAQHSGCRTPGR